MKRTTTIERKDNMYNRKKKVLNSFIKDNI